MKLSQFIDEVTEIDNPISITRNGESVAMLMNRQVYDGWEATLKIMGDVRFYSKLLENLRAVDRGEGFSHRLDELFEAVSWDEPGTRLPRLKVLEHARDDLRALDPLIQEKLMRMLLRVYSGDESVIQLRGALDGLMLLASGEYKMIYRWKLKTIEVVMVDLRATVYRKPLEI